MLAEGTGVESARDQCCAIAAGTAAQLGGMRDAAAAVMQAPTEIKIGCAWGAWPLLVVGLDGLEDPYEVLQAGPCGAGAPPARAFRSPQRGGYQLSLALLQFQELVLDRACMRGGRHRGVDEGFKHLRRAQRPRRCRRLPETPTFDDKAHDGDGPRLSDAMRSIDGLLLHRRVPPQIQELQGMMRGPVTGWLDSGMTSTRWEQGPPPGQRCLVEQEAGTSNARSPQKQTQHNRRAGSAGSSHHDVVGAGEVESHRGGLDGDEHDLDLGAVEEVTDALHTLLDAQRPVQPPVLNPGMRGSQDAGVGSRCRCSACLPVVPVLQQALRQCGLLRHPSPNPRQPPPHHHTCTHEHFAAVMPLHLTHGPEAGLPPCPAWMSTG